MKNRKKIIIVMLIFIVTIIVMAAIFLGKENISSNTINNNIPPDVIVIDTNIEEEFVEKIIDYEEPEIRSPLQTEKIQSIAEDFIEKYYNFNKSTSASYYSNLEKFIDTSYIESFNKGEPSPLFVLNKNNVNENKEWLVVSLKSITDIEIPVEANRDKKAEVIATVEYETTPFDAGIDTNINDNSKFIVKEKILLQFNEKYLLYSISVETISVDLK